MPNLNAQVRVSVNGGALQSGGVSAANGDTLQFSMLSTAGAAFARWTLSDYPDNTDLSAWSVDGNGIATHIGSTPPLLTVPDAPDWGKFMIAGELVPKEPYSGDRTTLIDESTAVSVPSPNLALQDVGRGETTQFNKRLAWLAAVKQALRNLELIEGGLPVPSGDDGSILVASGSGYTILNPSGSPGRFLTVNVNGEFVVGQEVTHVTGYGGTLTLRHADVASPSQITLAQSYISLELSGTSTIWRWLERTTNEYPDPDWSVVTRRRSDGVVVHRDPAEIADAADVERVVYTTGGSTEYVDVGLVSESGDSWARVGAQVTADDGTNLGFFEYAWLVTTRGGTVTIGSAVESSDTDDGGAPLGLPVDPVTLVEHDADYDFTGSSAAGWTVEGAASTSAAGLVLDGGNADIASPRPLSYPLTIHLDIDGGIAIGSVTTVGELVTLFDGAERRQTIGISGSDITDATGYSSSTFGSFGAIGSARDWSAVTSVTVVCVSPVETRVYVDGSYYVTSTRTHGGDTMQELRLGSASGQQLDWTVSRARVWQKAFSSREVATIGADSKSVALRLQGPVKDVGWDVRGAVTRRALPGAAA